MSRANALSLFFALHFGVRVQERRVARFIECPGRQRDDGLSRVLLSGSEAIAIQLQKQDSDYKASADEWVQGTLVFCAIIFYF